MKKEEETMKKEKESEVKADTNRITDNLTKKLNELAAKSIDGVIEHPIKSLAITLGCAYLIKKIVDK